MPFMALVPDTHITYIPRSPERTPCYTIIQHQLASFAADRESEGRPLPRYVIDEFEAYLRCGIHAHGFLRCRCLACGEEMVVAFSCKRRGFCPSCAAKRKAETAAHLIDNVLPLVPYRQFVVSFPIPLRFWLQTNKRLFTRIHEIVIGEVYRLYSEKAIQEGIDSPAPGSISFTQRWGSAANLNPHLHILCADGVYQRFDGIPRFRNLDPITDDDVADLAQSISHKVLRHLRRKGYLDRDGEVVENPAADSLFKDHDSIVQATACSVAGKIAFGPNAGKYVTRIGSGFGYAEEVPLAKGRLCATINGFSIHAATRTNTHARDRLAGLIEYIARGPLSNNRLEIMANGDVKLQLKSKWADGTTHLRFTPGEFLEKLAALIPPPRSHLVRWGGVFAPNSPYRKEITLKPHIKKGFQFVEEGGDPKLVKNHSWSKMLARVFKIDVTKCAKCGSDMALICAVTERRSIQRYLDHVGLDVTPPPRGPPRSAPDLVQGEFDFHHSDAVTLT